MRCSKQTEAVLFEQIKQLRTEMVPRSMQDCSSEESYEGADQQFPSRMTAGIQRLQTETSRLQRTNVQPVKLTPPQAQGPNSSSQQLPVQHQEHAPPPTHAAGRHVGDPRIPDFKEGEDPESFFVRFERIARTWGWQPIEWAARVVTLLTGKALEAYAGMDEERSESYEAIKSAVLMKYNVTEETYRQCFRSTAVPVGETVRETYNRIKGLYRRWMQWSRLVKSSSWSSTSGCYILISAPGLRNTIPRLEKKQRTWKNATQLLTGSP